MSLTTVFFPGPSKAGFNYRKAIVEVADIEYFIGMGAAMTPPSENEVEVSFEQDEEESEEPIEINPTKGWGRPGSFDWAKSHVLDIKSTQELAAYILEVTGKKLKDTYSLPVARGIATSMLKEHFKS